MNGETEAVPPEQLGFTGAMAELEQILARLDDERVDVDHLAMNVRRAGELIGFCRSRIYGTRLEIEQIVAEFDGSTSDPGGDG